MINMSLKSKNALVCGSSKGIGLASAVLLAELGANVILAARSEDKLNAAISKLDTSKGQSHMYIKVDYNNQADLRDKIGSLSSKKNIHILVNNTGGPPAGPIAKATPDEFLTAYNQHLICNHLLATTLLPGMESEGYGRIINIISTSVKSPLTNLGVSNTTRGAVASWSKTLAGEVASKGITVNNVLPGATNTGRLDEIINNKAKKSNKTKEATIASMQSIIPMGRFAEPSEIAAAVGFLASPAASYITGINIPVDGGRTKCL
jgi:3-oxoacyl-[acyl-carrier protein] reductase